MSNIWENAVITNKGVALQAKMLAGQSIEITSVKAGAGTVSVDSLVSQTAVSDIKQTLSIQPLQTSSNAVIIPVRLSNDGITTAYDLRQVGFYATDPDEGEVLYAIAQNTESRHIPTATEMPGYSLVWNFHFALSNDVNMTATVNTAGVATVADVEAAKEAMKITVDDALSDTSTNPVQNKIVKAELDKKADKANPVFTGYMSRGRKSGSTAGTASVALGYNVEASENYSFAEGHYTAASGKASHAEGGKYSSSGSSVLSTLTRDSSVDSNITSAVTVDGPVAYGTQSHAEGTQTLAYGYSSHAEGYRTIASGKDSHAEGYAAKASGEDSHAEGSVTISSGTNSHAEGNATTASGTNSHAEGCFTEALANQHAQGHYNDTSKATAAGSSGTDGTLFVIGNGTSSTASNAFRVQGNGAAYGKSAYNTSGADYAEFFEWGDGNPENEDRVGYFVTFADGELIKKAEEGDYILGIVSGNPSVIGNSDECWMGQNLMDEWGRFIYKDYSEVDPETGEEKHYTSYDVNPEYDPEMEYIHREDRPEWSAIGMLGALCVRDDGTCQVNGYCKCTAGGIATASERGIDTYRVIKRVTDNIVKVIFR